VLIQAVTSGYASAIGQTESRPWITVFFDDKLETKQPQSVAPAETSPWWS